MCLVNNFRKIVDVTPMSRRTVPISADVRKPQPIMDLPVMRCVRVQTYAHLSYPAGDASFVPCNIDAHKNNSTNSCLIDVSV